MEETKKISSKQVQQLFEFMKKKRVKFYDLQVELVDHFASAIEDLWKDNPELPFERAIDKVYSGFPVTGFAQVIREKRLILEREAMRWIFNSWKSYFQWPRILLSICVLIALRMLFLLPIPFSLLFWGIWATMLMALLWRSYELLIVPKKRGKRFCDWKQPTRQLVYLSVCFAVVTLLFTNL